jgi:hypothetical protein
MFSVVMYVKATCMYSLLTKTLHTEFNNFDDDKNNDNLNIFRRKY